MLPQATHGVINAKFAGYNSETVQANAKVTTKHEYQTVGVLGIYRIQCAIDNRIIRFQNVQYSGSGRIKL